MSKKKDGKTRRKEALKALTENNYFMSKIAILLKMEDRTKSDVKRAFKKAMKRQAEESTIEVSAWTNDGRHSHDHDYDNFMPEVKLDSEDKRKVRSRDRNKENADIFATILGQ